MSIFCEAKGTYNCCKRQGLPCRILPPQPRRRGLCIVRDDFFIEKSSLTHAVAPPLRNRSRSSRLFGCKRPHDGFVSLPPCFGFEPSVLLFSFQISRYIFVSADFLFDLWEDSNRLSIFCEAKGTYNCCKRQGLPCRILPPQPRRRGLCIVRDDFFIEKSSLTHAVAPPLRNRSRSSRLFGCKRPHDGFVSLPPCFGFEPSVLLFSFQISRYIFVSADFLFDLWEDSNRLSIFCEAKGTAPLWANEK